MTTIFYSALQLRELFHIEFLRWLGRSVKADRYAVKGGTNLRLFFKSIRYSEDMDLDVRLVAVHDLKDSVMDILRSSSFLGSLTPFGIEKIALPDMVKAKQTDTTQRFKVHLLTRSGEDLFTKVEFSRRGFDGNALVQPVPDSTMRAYKLAPLLVPHYDAPSAVAQKVSALAGRPSIQARDIFDLYILSSQHEPRSGPGSGISSQTFTKAHDNIFVIGFEQYRDAVVSYLSGEDRQIYDSEPFWDEIKLKVARFIEELQN